MSKLKDFCQATGEPPPVLDHLACFRTENIAIGRLDFFVAFRLR